MKNIAPHRFNAARSNVRPAFRMVALLICAALALVLTLSVAGCMSQLKQPPLDKKFYEIRTAQPGSSGTPILDAPLRVRRLNISPAYAGRELVFKTGSTMFDSDFYNLFFIPPADMLSQDLMNRLRSEGIFSHVVDPTSLVECRYVLEGMVNVLYGDYTADPGSAVVALQFFVLDEKKTDKSILFSKDYSKTVPLSANTADALVTGMNKAVDDIYSALVQDLRSFADTEKQHAQEGNQGDQ